MLCIQKDTPCKYYIVMSDSNYNCYTKDCVFYDENSPSYSNCRLIQVKIDKGKCIYYYDLKDKEKYPKMFSRHTDTITK